MSLRLILRPDAKADVRLAYRWYNKAAPRLGAAFLRQLETTLLYIERNPELYPIHFEGVRRALLRRFPYAVYYVVGVESVEVVACIHHRRRRSQWRSRL